MPRNTYHVVHDPDGGWNIKRGGAKRASKHFETKAAAISVGRELSRKNNAEFLIHGLNGKIQSADSHGKDLHPPKG